MNGVYQIYKRNSVTGQRDTLIQRYTSFELTLNWGTVSKFDIKGETIGSVDLASGDGVLFYRNNELLLSGVVEDVVVKCDTVANKKKSWTATGKDDSVIFSYRQILPDPLNLTFNENISDVTGAPDPETSEYGDDAYAYNRIIHYIYNNLGEGTTAERQISGLSLPSERSRGTQAMSSYRFRTLSEALEEIGGEENASGVENGMYPKYIWNPDTGLKSIEIPLEQRDMTALVTLSPELGNVTAWSMTTKMPEYNAVLVCSGTYEVTEEGQTEPTKTRMWVYVEDEESIAQFGRIEKVVTKSDIKVVEDDPNTEDVDESVTAAQVELLLRKEGKQLLKEKSFTKKYTITMVETQDLRFWTNWKCGDLVTCVIDGDKFTSTIKTVGITYKDGVETVKPTVGDVELGQFSNLYKWITGIDTRLSDEELSSD